MNVIACVCSYNAYHNTAILDAKWGKTKIFLCTTTQIRIIPVGSSVSDYQRK